MKKIFLCVMALVVCFSCFSCDKNDDETRSGETQRAKVTFSCPEDSSVNGKQVEVGWRENYQFPIPKRDGYIFDCWMYGDERIEANGAWPYSSDATLEAKWLLKAFYITYNMSPHYDTATTSFNAETDDFMLPVPKKVTGQMFIGWSGTGIDGVKKAVPVPKGSSGDRVYYANWISASEIENQENGFVFEIVSDHAVVVGYCGEYADTLVIPTEYKGYPVTTLGDSAFYGMGAFTKLLKVPYSITVLEDNALGACSGLPVAIYGGDFESWKANLTVGEGNGNPSGW